MKASFSGDFTSTSMSQTSSRGWGLLGHLKDFATLAFDPGAGAASPRREGPRQSRPRGHFRSSLGGPFGGIWQEAERGLSAA